MLSALQPQYSDFGPKVGPYSALGVTALKGCQRSAYMDHVIHDATNPVTELFSRPPLIRYLYQFNQCLTPAQREAIIQAELDPSQLFSHGTLNHAMMSSSSYYLLAERYPTLKWKDSSGNLLSSFEVASRYKKLLLSRFAKFMNDGFNEQLSPSYSVVDILPLLNLVDFSDDRNIRTGSEQQLIAALSIMAVDSFRGDLMPPLARENLPFQLNDDPLTSSRDVLWLYFGTGHISTTKRLEPPYAAMLATSPWRPPLELLTLRSRTPTPYEVKVATPSFSIWDAPTKPETSGGAYIDKDFAIGSGNSFADPSGYAAGTVAFRIMVGDLRPVGAVECYQPYWHGDEGEDAWDTDRSSPFQFAWRRRNEGGLIFDIPASDPYRFTNNKFFALRTRTADHLHQLSECRIPATADHIFTTPSGVYARYGRVVVALKALGAGRVELSRPATGPSKDFVVLKVRSPRSALFYRVDYTANYSSLDSFRLAVEAAAPAYDAAADQVRFSSGAFIKADFSLKPPAPDGVVAESPSFIWADSKLTFK